MSEGKKAHVIFTYGTLKRGYPNHPPMEELMSKNDAVFRGSCHTVDPYPLVCGLYGVPYLIRLPGQGHQVKGEVYAITADGLPRLDHLEGLSIGHYERHPIRVFLEGSREEVDAEAYFAHTRFGEALWKKRGRSAFGEYSFEDSREYVKIWDRPKENTHQSVVDQLLEFVGSAPDRVCD